VEGEARETEVRYWGCSQTVLKTLLHRFSIGNEEVFRAASALAGGVVAKREVCGALLGGVMAIGVMYGRESFEEGQIFRESGRSLEAQVRAGRLCEAFRDRFGGLRCSEVFVNVRGDDYREYPTLDTIEALRDQDTCGVVAGAAARMAADIMLQERASFQEEMNALAAEVAEPRRLQKQGNREP
jgi:C_GCAxxG_C_C family probable redox protein